MQKSLTNSSLHRVNKKAYKVLQKRIKILQIIPTAYFNCCLVCFLFAGKFVTLHFLTGWFFSAISLEIKTSKRSCFEEKKSLSKHLKFLDYFRLCLCMHSASFWNSGTECSCTLAWSKGHVFLDFIPWNISFRKKHPFVFYYCVEILQINLISHCILCRCSGMNL